MSVQPVIGRRRGAASWEARTVPLSSGDSVEVLLSPAGPGRATGRFAARYCIRAQPVLERVRGRPIFSLTLVLGRESDGSRHAIEPLVTQGFVSFDVSMLVPDEVIVWLRDHHEGDFHAAQLLAGEVSLETADKQVVASCPLGARGSVSAALDRERALAVLAAIDGSRSGLQLTVLALLPSVGAMPGPQVPRHGVSVPLEQVLGHCLHGQAREQFIHPVPWSGRRMVRSARRVSGRVASAQQRGARERVAAVAGGFVSMSLLLQPQRKRFSAHELLLNRPVAYPWADGIAAVDPDTPTVLPLPYVADAGAPLWTDHSDARSHWYAPEFAMAMPDPRSTSGNAPFDFTFRTTGTTLSGKPALTAVGRFTVVARQSLKTREAMQGLDATRVKPVPLSDLSACLELPFVDEHDGKPKVQSLPMQVEWIDGACVATIELVNDWVRLAYGALAVDGFQASPARIRLAYTIDAYVPAERGWMVAAFGAKVALASVMKVRAPLMQDGSRRQSDAWTTICRFNGGELRLSKEGDASTARRAGQGWMVSAASRPLLHAVSSVAIRPDVTLAPVLEDVASRVKVARRRLIREASLDALLPCATFGHCYREDREGESVAVGCRDALKLGQTEFRQFEEIAELACDFYRVHRSLQQPGRFLVVPMNYCVTRYASDVPAKAYRPVLYLYSVLDAEVVANNRILLHASLQPDIPVHEMRDLRRKLSALAASPQLVLPTQIQATLESVIALDDSLSSQPQVVQFPDSLQVTMPTDVAGARLLRACLEQEGIVGSATWRLPDGSAVSSSLRMRLDSIVGPWQQSVVEMAATDTGATLTNRCAQSVEVSEVRLYGDAEPVHVPVGVELAPGASTSVEFDRGQGEPVVVSSPVDSAATLLTEIRSFIEEITVSVAFVDLIDHAARGLDRLEIAAKLRGLDPVHHVGWNDDIGTVEIPLPITTEIDSPVLEYRVTKVMANGDRDVTPWLVSELAQGSVISLTWPGIQ